ncbi:MAG: tetraacyldisaccharide 4'-kinase [Rhizobiaceae bacterium]|nr:tetraacyldisaccharide 4'-kinase [Rhizobiaceae bacterium]
MVSEAPPFWWKKGDPRAWLLSPASLVYGYFAGRRMRHARRAEVGAPVICVGNFTVGGAGKTPTVITLARAAKARGLKPGVLSRGYGGSMDRTTVVDPDHHRARDVGDEPLLIAREALTVIARKRLDGARLLIDQGADLIIMDDGFQSAALHFDYALMVIDSRRGIGNGFLVPAGPVRAPTVLQLAHATALLKLGDGDGADPFIRIAARSGKPVYEGMVRPVGDASSIAGKRVLAFAGIADPAKFFRTVEGLGAEIVVARSFGDHQHLSDDEIADILATAGKQELAIITTAKDAVRLRGHHGPAEELAARATVIEVEMVFDSPTAPRLILDGALSGFRKRRLAAKAG